MDKNLYCLNRETGYQIWQKNSEYEYFSSDSGKKMFQISVNRFKQLESSLILIPGVNKITVINNINGAVISEYQFEKEIQYISEFDLIERSLFIIQQNQIKQIRLEIKY
jgi:outer membrane protein assembly factor BamB